jgi:hypothetical protein
MSVRSFAFAFLVLFSVGASSAMAQAISTAGYSGLSLSVGTTFSEYQADYSKRYLGGYVIYADADRTAHLGLEFEARVLRMNQEVGTHETTFLIGPRYNFRKNWFTPYAKILVGVGQFHYPYNYAEGSYLALAAGGGVDVPVGKTKFSVRAIDFEYQSWPNFSFGGLNPYGISAGVSYNIFKPE